MARIYCKKCGLRGDSKCPNCRSVFPDGHPDTLTSHAQEYFEMFMSVEKWDKDQKPSDSDGSQRWKVSFWSYDVSNENAIRKTLIRLQEILSVPGFNINVASCIHDWDLMPGVKSQIGCGCVGAPNDNVPADPYAQTK